MRKIELDEFVTVYQFEPVEGRFLGLNITVIKNGDRYLFIDAGYERNMKELLTILNPLKCDMLIGTHFHPDHIYGNHELNNHKIVGSKHANTTLMMFDDLDDNQLVPSYVISEDETIEYGSNSIKISLNQGHSLCGTIITVNDKYMFIGDDLMYTNEGDSVIPYLANTKQTQLDALLRIQKELGNHIVIPAHGTIQYQTDEIEIDLTKKINYMNYLISGKESYAEFAKEFNIDFTGKGWHKFNLQRD